MLLVRPLLVFGLAITSGTVSAGIASSDIVVDVREAPGASSADTLLALRRSLVDLQRSQKRDKILKNSTTLDKNWDGATLLSIVAQAETTNNVSVNVGVDIKCTTCYIKGVATAQFSTLGSFNATQAINNFTSEVGDGILNITHGVVDDLENYFPMVIENLGDGIDLDDFDFPPINATFNVDVPDVPECHLQFSFDGLELYMLIDTVLSAGATYNLNLYSSNTPIGISAGSDLFIGVIFAVDLILSVDADIDMSSGVHIQLEDGVGIDMTLFGQNVSDITFNGADFEFLPVTIESVGGLLKAVLRVGIKAGFELEPVSVFTTRGSAGVGVSVWANIAEFVTNVTATPQGDDEDCALRVEQTYQFGLGAAAGATLAIGQETWGPQPATNIPIFYTTIADACAIQGRTKTIAASSAAITARADEDLVTTTTTTKVTFTGTGCLTTGVVVCPASLQTVTKVTSTITLTTAVPSGVDATFPETTGTSVATPVPFGANVKTIEATTGPPVSYVPPPPPTSSSEAGGASGVSSDHPLGTVGGVDERIIIGVSVGLGVPVLAAIIAGIYICQRRRRYSAVSRNENEPVYLGTPQPYEGAAVSKGAGMKTSMIQTSARSP